MSLGTLFKKYIYIYIFFFDAKQKTLKCIKASMWWYMIWINYTWNHCRMSEFLCPAGISTRQCEYVLNSEAGPKHKHNDSTQTTIENALIWRFITTLKFQNNYITWVIFLTLAFKIAGMIFNWEARVEALVASSVKSCWTRDLKSLPAPERPSGADPDFWSKFPFKKHCYWVNVNKHW